MTSKSVAPRLALQKPWMPASDTIIQTVTVTLADGWAALGAQPPTAKWNQVVLGRHIDGAPRLQGHQPFPCCIHHSLGSVNICGANRPLITMFLTNYRLVFIFSDRRLC